MRNEKILSLIVRDVKKLKGFVDVVDRSGKEFIPGWSDIDISLIFKKIDYDLLLKLKKLFKRWRRLGRKIDLFIITKEDNPTTPFHFHGGYQLSYLKELEKSESKFKKYPLKNLYQYPPFLVSIDCYRMMALKIQEIRRTISFGGIRFYSTSLSIKARETMHVLKKAKTVFKMASQIIHSTNKKLPPEIRQFDNFYKQTKMKWNSIKNDEKILAKIDRKTINYAERIFKEISQKYLQILTQMILKK